MLGLLLLGLVGRVRCLSWGAMVARVAQAEEVWLATLRVRRQALLVQQRRGR